MWNCNHTLVDAERLLRALYDHLTVAREEDVFRFMGLGSAPGWEAFRARYTHDGRPDPVRAFADVAAHPATRARIEQMRAEFRAVIGRHHRGTGIGSHRG